MLETVALGLPLADAATVYTAAYWICLIVGGGLLILSSLGGGDHPDVDVHAATGFDVQADMPAHADVDAGGVDAHVDAGHADVGHISHAHSAASISTWFSIRFVVFFIAMFGAVGVILTYLTPVRPGLTFSLALLAGLCCGQGAHYVSRLVLRTGGNSTTQPQDYVNKLARVTIPVVHPDPGEVAIQVRSGERYLPAVACAPGRHFNTGDEVVVVSYRAGVAQVISRAEFEQQTHSA